jgi:hypothetical protein
MIQKKLLTGERLFRRRTALEFVDGKLPVGFVGEEIADGAWVSAESSKT